MTMFPDYEDQPGRHAKPEPESELSGLEEPVEVPGPRAEDGVVVTSKFGIPWKSIIGFLTVFVGQLLARAVVDGVAVLPTDLQGWSALLGGSAVAAFAIWAKSNVYTVPQATKNLDTAVKREAAAS